MSETNTNQIKKEEKIQAVNKKSNSKKWWIGALTLVFVLAIGGAVFNTLTQKISTSKADAVRPTSSKPCLQGQTEIPCPKPSRRPVAKPVVPSNPYQN
jgi:hypothetical protein